MSATEELKRRYREEYVAIQESDESFEKKQLAIRRLRLKFDKLEREQEKGRK
jgi:hypothetical protein